MRGLRVLLLGQGRLEFDGQPLTRLMAAKQQALVYYLAVAGAPVTRTRLAALLWGNADEAAARTNLRTALSKLRRWLPGVLDIDDRQVGFATGVPVAVDWAELTAALREGAPPDEREAAAAAWRGPLLDGLDVAASDDFERWLAQSRQRAERDAVALRRKLLALQEAAGAIDAAVAHARALLEIDDADEPAHMALMRLLAARGQRTAALAQYEACKAALVDRLGAKPSADFYALYTRIHAEVGPAVAPPAASAGLSSAPATSLAVPPAAADPAAADPAPPLVGRDAELALLAERLADPECRWLTIVGPGGVGKTRLAQAAAEALGERFRHGRLAFSGRDEGGALRDPETLAQLVLEHVGADRAAHGALLLVLDNLETVRDPRALAALLGKRAPGVAVLATSRRRVGGPREWLLELAGLPLARDAAGTPASSAAARLFAVAARRLAPGFDAAAEADAIEQVCARVGGLPLAIEIAARAAHLDGAAAVAARLACGAPLADPDRDPADPHRSTEIVLQESWAQLDDDARLAAMRLAWLPAQADAALASAIGVAPGQLTALRDQSWLQREGPARLALHPLQQDFLRRRPAAPALRAEVLQALARHLQQALPSVSPFGDIQPDQSARADGLAASAAFDAATLTDAAAAWCAEATLAALAPWIDSAAATLLHADRQGEAAALLANVLARADLPRWLVVGWGLRRGELLAGDGAASAAMRASSQALAAFGLGDVAADRADWPSLPGAALRLLARRDWPPPGPAREGFERLLQRSLLLTSAALTFSPDPMPAVRLAVLGDLLARRLGRDAEVRALFSSWGLLTFGHPRSAAWMLRRGARAGSHTKDPRMASFMRGGLCAMRIALGRWAGTAADIDAAADAARALRAGRLEMELRSLGAKLAFYEGRLDEALTRFAELSELSLRRPGEAWRAWGPIGQAETALCLGRLDDATLQRLLERATRVTTAMEDYDAAYTLRRLGLAARLAWRRGDAESAREAVLAGCAAAARLRHCGFWAHEGYAGLGDTLLALRRHERQAGGALPPLDAAWAGLEPALACHVRRFPAGAALATRLAGERRLDDGEAGSAALLQRAVAQAERQGLRVELARACEALARAPGGGRWGERAGRLWQEMGAAAAV